MTDEKETEKKPFVEADTGNQKEEKAIPFFVIIAVLILAIYSVLHMVTLLNSEPKSISLHETSNLEIENSVSQEIPVTQNATIKIKRIKTQPNCTLEEHIQSMLKEIIVELYIKKELCTPDDLYNLKKHSIPNMASNNKLAGEPRGYFVIYIAVGLLMTSLMAAFLDVYKVKGKSSKRKPQLTKRCSLADLTVLRHSRRESMKRDSMIDDHRVPLKLLGARPTPENRRYSYPAHKGDLNQEQVSPHQTSRKTSMDCNEMYSYDPYHNRAVRLIRRC